MTVESRATRQHSLIVKPNTSTPVKRHSTFHATSTTSTDVTRAPSPAFTPRNLSANPPQPQLTYTKHFASDLNDVAAHELCTATFHDKHTTLSDRHIRILSHISTIVQLTTGDIVIKKHETAMCVAVVLSGTVGGMLDVHNTRHTAYSAGDMIGASEWLHHTSQSITKPQSPTHTSVTLAPAGQCRQYDEIAVTSAQVALLTYTDLQQIETLMPDLYAKLLLLAVYATHAAAQQHQQQQKAMNRRSDSSKTFETTDEFTASLSLRAPDNVPRHHRRKSSLSNTRELAIQAEQLVSGQKYEAIYRHKFADEIAHLEADASNTDKSDVAPITDTVPVKHRTINLTDLLADNTYSTDTSTDTAHSRSSKSVKNADTMKMQREITYYKQKQSRHEEQLADRDAAVESLQAELKQFGDVQSRYATVRKELSQMHSKQKDLEASMNDSRAKQQKQAATELAELKRMQATELMQRDVQMQMSMNEANALKQQCVELQQKYDMYVNEVKQQQADTSVTDSVQYLQQQHDALKTEHTALQQTYTNNTAAYDNIVQQLRIKLGESERKLTTVIQWKQQAMVYADEWQHERGKLKKKLVKAHEQLTVAHQQVIGFRLLLQRLAIKQYVVQFKAKRALFALYDRVVHITTDSVTESLNERSLGVSTQVDSANDVALRINQRLHCLPWSKRRTTTPMCEYIEAIETEVDVLLQSMATVHQQKHKWQFTANIFFQRNIELTNTYIQHDKLLETTNENIYNITKHSKTLADKYNELQHKLKQCQVERDDALKLYNNEMRKQMHMDSDTQRNETAQFNRTVVLQRKSRELEQQCEALQGKRNKAQIQFDAIMSDKTALQQEYDHLHQQFGVLQQTVDGVLQASVGQTYNQLQTGVQLNDALNGKLPLGVLTHVTQGSRLPKTMSSARLKTGVAKRSQTAHANSKAGTKSMLPQIYQTHAHAVPDKVTAQVSQQKMLLDDALRQMSVGGGHTELLDIA